MANEFVARNGLIAQDTSRISGSLLVTGGNVGIGTATPTHPVNVYTTIADTGILLDSDTNPAFIIKRAGVERLKLTATGTIGTINGLGNGLVFQIDSTEQMRINTAGNVGIGTTSPVYKLDVNGTARAGGMTLNSFTSGTSGGNLELGFDGTHGVVQAINRSASWIPLYLSGVDIRFNPGGVEYMRLSSAGNLGIGTTSPGNKLQVHGSNDYSTIFSSDSGRAGWIIYKPGTSTAKASGLVLASDESFRLGTLSYYHIVLDQAGSTSIYSTAGSAATTFAANGNVGIGTTSPGAKLDVVGNAYFGLSDQVQIIGGDNGGLNYYAADGTSLVIKTSLYNNPIVFQINSIERVRISSSGSLGIGTSSPSARLQVSGSSNVVNIKGSGSLATSSLFSIDGAYGRLFEVTDDLSNSLFSVNTIAGLPVIEAFADYSVNLGTYSAASGSTMRITGSSVGIGTANPGTTLDVRGNIRATSFTGSFSGSITTSIGSNTQVIYNNAGVLAGSNNFVFNGTNVGIGTTSAGYPLDVKGTGTIARITDGTSHMVFYAGSNLNEISTVSPLLLTVNGSERMRITTGGNVGISTTAPSTKFEINTPTYTTFTGTSNVARFNALAGSGAATALLLTNYVSDLSTDTTVDLDFAAVDGNSVLGSIPHARIGYTGLYNDGINISPEYEARGYFRIATRTEGTGGILTDKIVVDYLGNSLFLSGSVGIGTTTPYSKFTTYGALSTSTSQISIVNSEGGHAIIRSGITGQSNNGMSFVIADVAGTNQNVAVVIASGGNVGIGTTNPSYKLEVNGNIWASDYYIQNTSGTSGTFRIDGFQDYLYFYGDTSAIAGYRFGSDTAGIVMQINTNGNVGIGTTSPNSQLDVYTSQGGSRISATHGTGGSYPKASGISFGATSTSLSVSNNGSTTVFTGGAGIYANNSAASNNITDLVFWTTIGGSPAEKIRITSGGSLLIGASSQGYNPETLGYMLGVKSSTSQAFISVAKSGQTLDTGGIVFGLDSSNAYTWVRENIPFLIGTNNTEKLRVTSNGNVGIGTTSPQNLLQVGSLSSANLVGGTNWNQVARFGSSNRLTSIVIQAAGTGAVSASQGLPAIEFEPYNVDASSKIKTAIVAVDNYYSYRKTDLAFVLDSADDLNPWQLTDAKLYIKNDGNVGIGTTSPTVKLDIVSSGGSGLRIIDSTSPNFYINNTSVQWKIYLPASSNDFRINDAVGDYVTIKYNSGNVGIGTTAPERTLHVVGDAVFSGTSAGIYFKGNTNNPFIWVEDAQSLRFGTNNTERVRITSGGIVGIGTSSPSGHQLDVASSQGGSGNSAIRALYPAGGGLANTEFGALAYRDSVWTAVYGKQGSASSAGYFDGNVGIGTASPSAKLHIGESGAAAQLWLQRTDGYNPVKLIGGTLTDGNGFKITMNTTDAFAITSGGNVGIGTTSPIYSLDAYNTAASTARIRILGATNYTLLQAQNNSGVLYTGIDDSAGSGFNLGGYSRIIWSSNAYPLVFAVNDAERMRITSGGNVGIGTTSPAYKLDVNGETNSVNGFRYNGVPVIYNASTDVYANIRVLTSNSTYNDGMYINYNSSGSTSAHLRFFANAANERMRIDAASGNVGIGTTSPAYKLDVNGTLGVTGASTFGGLITQSTLTSTAAEFVFANTANNWSIKTGTTINEFKIVENQFGGIPLTIASTGAATFSSSVTANSIESTNMGRFKGWYASGTGAAAEVGVSSGIGYLYGYNRTTSTGIPIEVIGTTVKLGISGVGDSLTIANNLAATFSSSVTAVSFVETSTKTKKDNIKSYSTDISKFKQLEPVSFNWKDTGKSDVGLIAEEVDQLFPEFVSKTDEGEVTGINYGKLTTILINIVKQQQERIEKLEQQINR